MATIDELIEAEIAHQERQGAATPRGATLEDLKAERARRDRLQTNGERRGITNRDILNELRPRLDSGEIPPDQVEAVREGLRVGRTEPPDAAPAVGQSAPMSPEQQKALALARARMRAQADQGNGVTDDDVRAELDRRYRAFEADVIAPPPLDAPDDYVKPVSEAPAGYWERTRGGEPTEQPTRLEDELLRGLRIGGQGVGRGLAGIVGLPADLAELGLNAGAAATDLVAGTELPRFEDSIGSSEWIADQTARLVEAFGGDEAIIDQDEMTPV